jgi:hypothetical protein
MDQLYATASQMQAPVLIHVDGDFEWCNRSFSDRFGVKSEGNGRIKVKELLWCLGMTDPICGMVAEGALLHNCQMPPPNPSDSAILLTHKPLPMLSDGRKRMLLVLADEFDPEPADLCFADN